MSADTSAAQMAQGKQNRVAAPGVLREKRKSTIASARSLVSSLDGFDLLFLIIAALAAIPAWRIVSSVSTPLGADGGNYLVTMRVVFGQDPTGMGLLRPPLIAIPLKIATSFLSPIPAMKLLAIAAWELTGVGAFILYRRLGIGGSVGAITALFASTAYLFSSGFGTMIVWGWISFLGIATVPLLALPFLGGQRAFSTRQTRNRAAAAALLLLLLGATHQVSFFFAVVWLGVYCASLLVFRRKQMFVFVVKCGVAGGLASLVLAPLYYKLASGIPGDNWTLHLAPPSQVLSDLSAFYSKPSPILWMVVFLAACAGLVVLWLSSREVGSTPALLMGTLLATPFLFVLIGHPMRMRMLYFTYLPLWGLSLIAVQAGLMRVMRLRIGAVDRRPLFITGGALAGIVGIFLLYSHFVDRANGALGFYTLVTEPEVQAVNVINKTMPANAQFIASPFSLGWWIEGAAGRNAYEEGRFQNRLQNVQAAITERILSGNYSISNGPLLLGDSYPEPVAGTPSIWVALPDGERLPYAYFDNRATTVESGNSQKMAPVQSLQDMGRHLNVLQSADVLGLTKSFQGTAVSVTQTSSVQHGSSTWRVDYSFRVRPGFSIQKVVLPLHLVNLVQSSVGQPGHFSIASTFRQMSGESYNVLTDLDVSGVGTAVDAHIEKSGSGDQALNISLAPTADFFTLTVTGEVLGSRPANQDGPPTPLPFHSGDALNYEQARNLVTQNGLDYMAIDWSPAARLNQLSSATQDWVDTSPGFQRISTSGSVSIYKIVPAGFVQDVAAAEAPVNNQVLEWRQTLDFSSVQGWSTTNGALPQLEPLANGGSPGIDSQVDVQPGRWSGLTYAPSTQMDLTGAQAFLLKFEWSGVGNIDTMSFGFDDAQGRRWAWHILPSDLAKEGSGAPVSVRLALADAFRQDKGFDWAHIKQAFITGLGKPDIAPTTASVAWESLSALLPSS